MFPEYELLAAASAADPGTEPAAAPGRVDWERLLRLAEWHRVTPLLFRYVRGRPELAVPEAIADRLEASYSRTAAANVNLRRELDRVAALFREAGVAVIVLKGMALIEAVYRDLALRPMADLDLLVPEADFVRAGKLLEAAGYDGYQGFTPSLSGPWRGAFVKGDGTAGIDLHRHVSDGVPALDVARLFERAVPSDRGQYLLLERPDLLLHLALHFMQHRDTSSRDALGQLADMAWLIDGGIDWPVVVERVETTGTQGRVFLALSAVARLFAGRIPQEVLASLAPAPVDAGPRAASSS